MKKDYTFMCLRAINHAAKRQGEIKKAAYAAGDHHKCAAAKATQKELYLLKALTLIDLERKGLVYRGKRCIDGAENIYETFYSVENNCFHSISQNQEMMPDETVDMYDRRSRDYSRCEIYRPYVYYLQQRLPDDLTDLQYHILHDREEALCDALEKYNVRACVWLKKFDYGCGNGATFAIRIFLEGVELGIFDKYSYDTDQVFYYTDDGRLVCETSCDYEWYCNFKRW